MHIKTMAGTAMVPTFSRFVLGITFILSGWFFCFQTIEFTSADLAGIQNQPQAASGAEAAPADESTGRALAVNRLILHFHSWDLQNWAQPLGWAVAIFQLLGGAMLLLGLFTRIIALGLSVIIGGAFYKVTLCQNGMFEMNPFTWRLDSALWYAIISQAALFVLAFGLIFTGGGPLCLERVLWGRTQNAGGAPKTNKGDGGD